MTTGRQKDDLVQDATASYLEELTQVRSSIDGRYDDIKSGTVKPIGGEEAFARLRCKSEERRSQRSLASMYFIQRRTPAWMKFASLPPRTI